MKIARADTGKARREDIDGDEFLVVPMVALKTGVYQCANCPDPELYDAEVFARIPESWNDRPVTLGHPQREGLFVSAGSQDVWRKEGLGRIRNARRDGDKLVMEAWVDLMKADDLGDPAAELIGALEAGDRIDVSVGAFIPTLHRPGAHKGKDYVHIQTAHFPDHVAFLPGAKGACSWEDGCGAPRVNKAIEDSTMTLQQPPPGQDELPLKVACECGGDGECTCEPKMAKGGIIPQHSGPLTGMLQFKNQAIGDQARRRVLATALTEKMGRDMWFSVVEVFEGTVVYEASGGMFSRDFTITEDGTVTLSDDPVQGALVAEFMPITVQQEKDEMTERAKAVDGLIASEAAPWGEDDRQFLLDASDDQFEKLSANVSDPETPPGNPGQETPSNEGAPPTTAEFLASAPPEVAETLNEGLAELGRVRTELTDQVKASSQNTFTDDQLAAMSMDQLRKVAALAAQPAGPQAPQDLGELPANYAAQNPAASMQRGNGLMPMPKEPEWTGSAAK